MREIRLSGSGEWAVLSRPYLIISIAFALFFGFRYPTGLLRPAQCFK